MSLLRMCGAALLLGLQACGPVDPNGPAARPVASVNGRPVDADLLDALIRSRRGMANPFQETGLADAPAAVDPQAALNDLVLAEVLAQEAMARGIDRRPDVRAELELQRKTLLGQQLVRELLGEMQVDERDLERRHRRQPAELEYHVHHVLVHDEATARSVIAELDAGAAFGAVARRYSMDPQSPDGRLGWLMLNQLETPFARALSSLKPGQHTRKPVQTSYGWHVVRLEEYRVLPKPPFEEMRAALREELLHERLQARLERFRDQADVHLAGAAGEGGR